MTRPMRQQRPGEVVRIFYAGVGDAMREPGVVDAANRRAEGIARNAAALVRGAGIDAEVTVEQSTRPRGRKGKGRPQAQVRATTDDAEERAHLLSLLQASGRVV